MREGAAGAGHASGIQQRDLEPEAAAQFVAPLVAHSRWRDDEGAAVAPPVEEAPRRSIRNAVTIPPAIAAVWRYIADVMSHALGISAGGAPESTEEPEERPWITDARRVGPPPRLRVRIKISR